jgi:hypothetical protein
MRKKSRAEYHRAISLAKKNEQKIRSNRWAENLLLNKTKTFWTEVKRTKGRGCRMPISVDGATGDENISEVFASKFKTTFNMVPSKDNDIHETKCVIENIAASMSAEEIENCLITSSDMFEIIKYLKSGKSDGGLGLYSDHVIHATEMFYKYLTFLFNCMMIHCTAPSDMLTGTMLPLPKGKRLNLNNSDNFRGICLQSHFCKLLDIFMLKKECKSLQTSDTQFGFKEKLSATLATSIVTETIDYYNNGGGMVFGLALDASKAFDRVEFKAMFDILLKRNFNPIYMRLMFNMYVNQKVRVKYNNTFSDYFSVSNGVKQGGVISPTLFTCYVDGMLEELKSSGLGCKMGHIYTGSISYADDLILLAPTIGALKGMVAICEQYAEKHKILFNGRKSKLIVFNNTGDIRPKIYVNKEQVEQVSKITYLGHTLHADRNNPHIEDIKRDFVSKFNAFIGDFSQVSSEINQRLFYTYCMSMYGLNICDFESNAMNSLYTEWRKCVRRVLRVPPRTHSVLLCHILQSLPPEVIFMQRFLQFFFAGYNSHNETVNFVFKQSICSKSRIGNNLKHIMNKISICVCDATKHKPDFLCRKVSDCWFSLCNEHDIAVGHQIRELMLMRDSIYNDVLNFSQCQEIINYLCTS